MLARLLLLPAIAAGLTPPLNAGEQFMSTLGGTAQKGGSNGAATQELSFGNVLPETQLPWAQSGWSPVTDLSSGSWFFSSRDNHFYGIRCTHQPSPWLGDYGQFRIAHSVVDPTHGSPTAYDLYNPAAAGSTFSPYLFEATLLGAGGGSGYGSLALAPTAHGAILRLRFPPRDASARAAGYNQTRRVALFLDAPGTDALALGVEVGSGLLTFSGVATSNGAGGHPGKLPASFGHHFYATLSDARGGALQPASAAVRPNDGGLLWAFADFSPADNATQELLLRVGTSFISPAQARANHDAQLAGRSFDALAAAARATWAALAARVSVADLGGAGQGALTTFYSSLYRASKYPRSFMEPGGVHWSPYTGAVVAGELSTDVGQWDAYRTTPGLLSLINPSRLAGMMEGWLAAWREGGWVPQWSSPGYRGAMTGTMSDVVFAEAIVKLPACAGTGGGAEDGGARARLAGYCVNATGLLLASLQNAYVAPPAGVVGGRACLAEYLQLGYVPSDAPCDSGLTRTVNYLHGDWAIAQAARLLGRAADAALLEARAANYTRLLEASTGGFFVPRNSAGEFNASAWDEFAWGGGFDEAGPWQYRFEAPYDPQGLKRALAGMGVDACALGGQFNTMPSYFRPGTNPGITHEMAEMSINCFGQWELNNQPSWVMQHMQVAFDTAVTGACAQQAQPWLRKSAALFRPGADMFPGDEDNGSMGAWYILNALGLYPLSPASGDYVLGSPLFGNVSITIDGASQPLMIVALNQGPANVYVHAVEWNGVPLPGVTVPYASLMQGGVLQFTMAATPAA